MLRSARLFPSLPPTRLSKAALCHRDHCSGSLTGLCSSSYPPHLRSMHQPASSNFLAQNLPDSPVPLKWTQNPDLSAFSVPGPAVLPCPSFSQPPAQPPFAHRLGLTSDVTPSAHQSKPRPSYSFSCSTLSFCSGYFSRRVCEFIISTTL